MRQELADGVVDVVRKELRLQWGSQASDVDDERYDEHVVEPLDDGDKRYDEHGDERYDD